MKKEKKNLKKDITRQIKRSLIRFIGWVTGDMTPVQGPVTDAKSVVILAQEKLGDCILLTPLLRLIKENRPEISVTLICFSKASSAFFQTDSHVAEVVLVKNRFWSFLFNSRNREFDVLFNSKDHPSFNFMLATLFIKAKVKTGIYHDYHTRYFNHEFNPEFYSQVALKNALLAGFLGISYEPDKVRPYLPNLPVREDITEFSKQIKAEKAIAINLSSGNPDREWPEAYWEQFLGNINQKVIILAVGNRIGDKINLEKKFGNVIPSPETKNLNEAGELISGVSLLVTPDTSLIHVAACFGTPVCGLFQAGDLHFKRFHPLNIRYKAIQSESWKLSEIPPETVIEKVKELLNGK